MKKAVLREKCRRYGHVSLLGLSDDRALTVTGSSLAAEPFFQKPMDRKAGSDQGGQDLNLRPSGYEAIRSRRGMQQINDLQCVPFSKSFSLRHNLGTLKVISARTVSAAAFELATAPRSCQRWAVD
jgi:hypothetical protein